ncbi:MAG: S8 family serine peptidase [Bdellovibrionota bacterium]
MFAQINRLCRKSPKYSVLLFSVFLAVSCAPKHDQTFEKKLESAIIRMQNGELVRQIEDSQKSNSASLLSDAGEFVEPAPLVPPVVIENLTSASSPANVDPCLEQIPLADFLLSAASITGDVDISIGTIDVRKAAAEKLCACMRKQMERPTLLSAAFEYFRYVKLDKNEKPLSTLSDNDLKAFLEANRFGTIDILLGGSKVSKLRSSFSDNEIQELVALASNHKKALFTASANIFAMVESNLDVFEELGKTVNRYRLLLGLNKLSKALNSAALATNEVSNVLDEIIDIFPLDEIFMAADNFDTLPSDFLLPYAIISVVPNVGSELDQLDIRENPFLVATEAWGNLGGSSLSVANASTLYSVSRDMYDTVPMPEHPQPAADAAHVAILDSGIDFRSFPDLGLFLGREGKSGELASHDYADGDSNPYLPAIDDFSHGSGTSATLLTIVANYAPEILRERKLDLAVWKTVSLRELLSGKYQRAQSWTNRLSCFDAVLDNSTSGDERLKPKVVSVSLSFNTYDFLGMVPNGELIKNTPWLWVMAAGNDGVDVNAGILPSCFSDLPADKRNDSRILCVGALVRGMAGKANDKIAGYSNFGDRVDVYAYDSYISLCPNGTSCSTPAISGAAAILAAKFPMLSPEQIKEVILESAEEQTLEVDGKKMNSVKRTVMVFDPSKRIQVAIENAKKKLGL